MSQLTTTTEQLPAKESAFAGMLGDHDERREELQAFFASRDRLRERVAEIRKDDEATMMRSVLLEQRHYEPEALAIISKLRTLQMRSPYKAARTYFQVLLGCNALGLDKNIEPPPPRAEEDGPVFDRTRTGARQGGSKFGPEGDALLRRMGDNVRRTTISLRLVNEMVELLSQDLPIPKSKGRPSNVFLASEERARDLVAREFQRARDAGEEIGEREAAERVAGQLREGTGQLRLIEGSQNIAEDVQP